MARYYQGPLGDFSGKLGPVVGARWKGIAYMRSKNRIRTKPFTPAQLRHQAKFSCVAKFIHSITALLKVTYPKTDLLTGTNQAFSDVYNNAVVGDFPDYQLNYSRICCSIGPLQNAENIVAFTTGNGMIQFSWTNNSNGFMANEEDRCIMLAHFPGEKLSLYNLSGAQRNAGADSLNGVNYRGKTVHTWLSFIKSDGTAVATSVYTGMVEI